MTPTAVDMTVRRRNAAIKKVLQQRFGDVPISVRSLHGYGYRIDCRIALDIPFEQEAKLKGELVHAIRHAGIALPYAGDIRFGFAENEAWVRGKA
jgi:hypothetical protein